MAMKNPFALRNGKTIMIADINPSEKGRKCNCICPYCKGHFIAAIGKVVQPYFRHDGQPCDATKMLMTALYGLFRDALEERKTFLCPAAYGDAIDTNHINVYSTNHGVSEQILKAQNVSVIHSNIQLDRKGMPIAMIITCYSSSGNRDLAIVLTPPQTICKTPEAKPFKNHPTISIDMNQKIKFFAI